MNPAEIKDQEIDYEVFGNDEASATVAPDDVQVAIDTGLAMKLISMRLPDSLIEELKIIAEYRGIGYQPLMRDVLKKFAAAEWKLIAIELYEKSKVDGLEPAKKIA